MGECLRCHCLVCLFFSVLKSKETAPLAEENKRTSAVVIIVPALVFLIVVSTVLVYVFKRKVRRNNTGRNLGTTTEEGLEDSERTTLLDHAEIEHFKEVLQDKYSKLFPNNIVLEMIPQADDTKEILDKTETCDDINTEHVEYIDDTVNGKSPSVEIYPSDDKISSKPKDSKSADNQEESDPPKISIEEELGTGEVTGRPSDTSSSTENPLPTDSDGVCPFSKNRSFPLLMVQILMSRPGNGVQGIWKNCTSISQVLTTSNIGTNRFIFEGEFGYNISSISNLLAYKWSMERETSLASHFDILIVLRLDQVSCDKSVYSEIHRLLLSGDTSLTTESITRTLENHDKVAFVLDGLNISGVRDCKGNCQIAQIMRGDILKKCTVILFGSPCCVHSISVEKIIRLRAKDLSRSDQDFRIREFFSEDTNSQDKIKSFIEESILLRDVLKVPLFFDIFLKMVRGITNMPKIESLFCSFLTIMSSLYLKNLMNGEHENVAMWDVKLGEIAFDALKCKREQKKRWKKDALFKSLTEQAYNFYQRIGVLKEEEIPQWDSQPTPSENVPVRFAHSLFCEWFAAQYLSKSLKEKDIQFEEGELSSLVSNDYWYCIRFLCGYDAGICRAICKVIQPKVLQILCQLEENERVESIPDMVQTWCSTEVSVSKDYSKVQQMAIVQLLEFGAMREVSHLALDNCFNSVEGEFDYLEFRSGVQLPVIKNLKRLDIIEEGREFTNEEVTGILKFVSRCSRLENVKFLNCMLPRTIEKMPIAAKSKLRDVKVEWIPFNSDSSHAYDLIVKALTWKQHKGAKMNKFTYRGLEEEFRDQHGKRNFGISMGFDKMREMKEASSH